MEKSVLRKYQPGLVTSTKQLAYGTFFFDDASRETEFRIR